MWLQAAVGFLLSLHISQMLGKSVTELTIWWTGQSGQLLRAVKKHGRELIVLHVLSSVFPLWERHVALLQLLACCCGKGVLSSRGQKWIFFWALAQITFLFPLIYTKHADSKELKVANTSKAGVWLNRNFLPVVLLLANEWIGFE